MESQWLIFNDQDVEVFYDKSSACPSNDYDVPSYSEEITIHEVKYCDVDIIDELSRLDIKELEEQL